MIDRKNLTNRCAALALILFPFVTHSVLAEVFDANILPNDQNIVISADARWYQVNVLVFSQNTVVERDPEMWPLYPTLDRSVPPITLFNPPSPDAPLLDDSAVDAFSDIDSPFYGLDEPGLDGPGLDALGQETPFTEDPLTEDPLTAVQPFERPAWIAFEKLPESQRYLNPYAERLDRDRRFTILFHESWIQPIEAASIARPISITGGYHSGLLDELSGLLKISISRYLHLNTQLYLTDIVESSDPFDLLTGQKYAFVPLTFPNPVTDALGDTEGLLAPKFEPIVPIDLAAFHTLNADTDAPDYFDIPKTYAVAVTSVLMQETRRMRSKELHYIDNPKMGLLIYFTPFDITAEPEELLADEIEPAIEVNVIDTLQ